MSAPVLAPTGSSRVLWVLSLLVSTAAAAQGYTPPPQQQYAPPPQQQYAPPPQQQYAPPPQQQYAPPPQQQYAPPPQQQYAPPPQQQYAPPPQQGYAPPQQGYAPPQQQYAPPPAPGYAPPTYAPPPPAAAVPVSAYAATAPNPDEVSDFVSKISSSARFDRGIVTRWRAPLCFNVQGLPEAENRFVLGRLSQIATYSGAQVQSESDGCSKGAYNFNVVFTLNANQAAHDWYSRHRDMFDTNSTPTQVRRFLNPPSPVAVRVWHDATLFGTDGQPLMRLDPGDPVEPVPDVYSTGSRLTAQATIGLNYALVIIDGKLANGAGLAQLTDYAAMTGLADLDLEADVGSVPTILRLFAESPQQRPAGLTGWDQSFLSALYHSEQSSRNLRAQLAGTVAHNGVSP
jgi:hypothetical protein